MVLTKKLVEEISQHSSTSVEEHTRYRDCIVFDKGSEIKKSDIAQIQLSEINKLIKILTDKGESPVAILFHEEKNEDKTQFWWSLWTDR